jgi:hypothetical protein
MMVRDDLPRIDQMVLEGLVGSDDRAERKDQTMPAAVRKLQVDRSAVMKCQDKQSETPTRPGAVSTYMLTGSDLGDAASDLLSFVGQYGTLAD